MLQIHRLEQDDRSRIANRLRRARKRRPRSKRGPAHFGQRAVDEGMKAFHVEWVERVGVG
jgi:hypothetical protein